METRVKFYAGKCQVNMTCREQGHNRQYVLCDIEIDCHGWASWIDSDGRKQGGFMGMGKCCRLPIIQPVEGAA